MWEVSCLFTCQGAKTHKADKDGLQPLREYPVVSWHAGGETAFHTHLNQATKQSRPL